LIEIALRLHAIPSQVNVATCNFNSVQDATEAVIDIKKLGFKFLRSSRFI